MISYVAAKIAQNYDENPIRRMCSNCVNFKFDNWTQQKNPRCSIGGFAVKKTAVCEEHQFKYEVK